ncbi:MAG: 2-oxo acid dehydrogenase subunit E2 [Dehalococcoidia bacterium]|nr:2-oxo acid dehydrogenase subunit E2 [Dehalococcoidia bacterium]
MAIEVKMPQMGFDMKEGKIVRWLRKEGDRIIRGEPLLEIETDKAVVEVEAFSPGVLSRIVVGEGDTVPVGEIIGFIGAPGETVDAPAKSGGAKPAASPAPAKTAAAPVAPPAPAMADPSGEMKVSPIARKIAEEKGIDLRTIKGTGPGGRVQKEDVLAVAEGRVQPAAAAPSAPTAAPAPAMVSAAPAPAATPAIKADETIPLSRMRTGIAKIMVQSKNGIPHFYVENMIDMTEAMRFRKELNETSGLEVKISVNDLVVKAVTKSLQKHPKLNSTYTEQGLVVHKNINIGIAISLEDGLVAPAILQCESKSLAEIAVASKGLQERAKKNQLRQEEYSAPTFNVSNMGMFDVDWFSAIITPGQSGVLALGSIKPQPVVVNDQIVIRQMMPSTISADHRATDGVAAAQFLQDVKAFLQNPMRLLL